MIRATRADSLSTRALCRSASSFVFWASSSPRGGRSCSWSCLAGLLRLGDDEGPLAQSLAFGVEPGLGLGELIEAGLDDRFLLGRLRDPEFEGGRLLAHLLLVAPESFLGLAELGDRLGEDGLALGELFPLADEERRFLDDLGELTFRLGPLRLAVGGEERHGGSLGFEGDFLLAHLLAHPFEPAAESGDGGLLSLERRGPLRQTGGRDFLLGLRHLEPGRLVGEIDSEAVELVGLGFEFGAVGEKLLFARLQSLAPLGDLALALIERSL